MEIGIIGLARSGKTTVFNALTRGRAETAAHAHAAAAPNVGVVKVPDPRLDVLTEMLKPKRTIPAEVKYVDYAAPVAPGRGQGLGGTLLADLSRADALIHVVRAFHDDRLPHIEGSVEPGRDIATMNMELAFSDLAIIERRLERIEASLKGARPPEREAALKEKALLSRVKSALEGERPLREQELSAEERHALENFQFLTAKPLLLLINIGEGQLAAAASLEEDFRHHQRPGCEVAVLCGQLEMELSQLGDEEAEEFRSAMGVDEAALGRVIRLSYRLLGLVSFFTTASDEVKAWTVRHNTTAQRAAGKIHSDMERGFIRAEVISYDDLVKMGSMAEARKRGLLHLEGKSYTVQDGDVMTILFNV